MRVHVCVRACVCLCIGVHVCMCACMYVSIHVCICMFYLTDVSAILTEKCWPNANINDVGENGN